MHLNARNSLKAFVPARCKAGSGEEHISITRRVTDKSSDVLFELLVTRRVRSREYLGSNQICHNALDVSTGVGPKCQSKSAGVGMKFDKSFNCAHAAPDSFRIARHQHRCRMTAYTPECPWLLGLCDVQQRERHRHREGQQC
jgi:hypothetical protein